jgi:hypothetical protein
MYDYRKSITVTVPREFEAVIELGIREHHDRLLGERSDLAAAFPHVKRQVAEECAGLRRRVARAADRAGDNGDITFKVTFDEAQSFFIGAIPLARSRGGSLTEWVVKLSGAIEYERDRRSFKERHEDYGDDDFMDDDEDSDDEEDES